MKPSLLLLTFAVFAHYSLICTASPPPKVRGELTVNGQPLAEIKAEKVAEWRFKFFYLDSGKQVTKFQKI